MSQISDRHSRPVKGLKGVAAKAWFVRVRLGANSIHTVGGQLTATCLVNLLARLTDVVGTIEIVATDMELLVSAPGPRSVSLIETLYRTVGWAVGDDVAVQLGESSNEPDFTLHVGADVDGVLPDEGLVVSGSGWRAWVGSSEKSAVSEFTDDPNALGPFLAASLATSEIFKRARGAGPKHRLKNYGYSVWSGTSSESWEALTDGPKFDQLAFPPFYIVGAGAVGQALVYLLGASGAQGFAVAIDDDEHDDSNLNRCFLAGIGDSMHPKVEAIEVYSQSTRFKVRGFKKTISDYVGEAHAGLPDSLSRRENEGRFEIVVSCVDKGVSRQDIQGLWPRLIFGGSNDGLTAKAICYDLSASTACLGCHNPAEPEGAQLRILQQQVRLMNREERVIFLTGKVQNLQQVLDFLDEPECGKVGEAEFNALAQTHGNAFAASFVSMGAGVLLLGSIVRRLLFLDLTPHRDMMASLNFLNGGAIDTALAISSTCSKCQGGGRDRFEATWAGEPAV